MVSLAQHGSHHLLPGTHDPRGRTDCGSTLQCVTNTQYHHLFLNPQKQQSYLCVFQITYVFFTYSVYRLSLVHATYSLSKRDNTGRKTVCLSLCVRKSSPNSTISSIRSQFYRLLLFWGRLQLNMLIHVIFSSSRCGCLQLYVLICWVGSFSRS